MGLELKFGTYKFEPRPFFSLDTYETQEGASQEEFYTIRRLTLQGKIFEQSCPAKVAEKAKALYDLYNTTGLLEILSDGTSIHSFPSIVSSINFSETPDNWSTTLDYTLELQSLAGTGILSKTDEPISDYTNSLTVETIPGDQQYGDIYRVTSTLGAVGLVMSTGDSPVCNEPGKKARQYINDALKSNIVLSTNSQYKYESVFGFAGADYSFFNTQYSWDFDEFTGSYNVTTSWIMKDKIDGIEAGPYFSNSTVRLDNANNLRKTITIEGTFAGLSSGIFTRSVPVTNCNGKIDGGDSSSDRYENAVRGFNLYNPQDTLDAYKSKLKDLIPEDNEWDGGRYFPKAQQLKMNTSLARSQIGYNPYQGTITYSYTYDDKPEPHITDAIFESISITSKEPNSKIETIQVLGRRQGPIIRESATEYDIGTSTITYEGIFPKTTELKKYSFKQSIIEEIDDLVYSYGPDALSNNVSIVEDKQDLNLTSNKVTRTITWNYSPCSTNN